MRLGDAEDKTQAPSILNASRPLPACTKGHGRLAVSIAMASMGMRLNAARSGLARKLFDDKCVTSHVTHSIPPL